MDILKKYIGYILLLLIIVISFTYVFSTKYLEISERKPSYDELMWTNTSIASYHMFVGYQRKDVRPDGWFTNYAYKNELDLFKPITSQVLEVDYNKIDPAIYQWFDGTLWTFGWKAPNFSKILKGWYINSKVENLNPEGYYELGKIEAKENPNIYYSRVPIEFVKYGRQVDAFFCVLSLVLVFLLGWKLFNLKVGVFAWLYLLLNDSFIKVSTAAGMDSTLFFFSLSSVFVLHLILSELFERGRNIKIILGLSLLMGLCLGLAVSSKYNGATLFVALIYLVPVVLFLFWKNIPQLTKADLIGVKQKKVIKKISDHRKVKNDYYFQWFKSAFFVVTLISSVSLSVFFYVNPHMKGESSKKVTIIRESVDEFFGRRAVALKTTHIKDSWVESFKLVSNKNYFSIGDGEDHKFLGTFGELIPGSFKVVDGLFLLFGLFIVIKMFFYQTFKENKYHPAQVVLVMYVVIFYMNVDFIWVSFTRYFTPFYILGSVIIALGIDGLVTIVKNNMKIFRSVGELK